ncbi:MAG: acyl-CoA dehydrogenase family protein [Gammaproteobacteria bacterium]
MGFVLTEEQQILRSSAGEYFNDRLPVSALRQLRDTNSERGYDTATWAEMADMGWAGILVPEDHGGVAFGYRGLGEVLEAGGRTLAASPLISTALTAAPLIAALGSESQQASLLQPIAAGEAIVALALDEGAKHAPESISTMAVQKDEAYVINGDKRFIVDGHVADVLIVATRVSDGRAALFLIERARAGVTIRRRSMVDARNCADIEFRDVRVSSADMLGEPGAVQAELERVLDGARAGVAAEMLGAGLEAFERTVAYLKVREQFDVPIGSFQALKHRAALMFCELELTKSAVAAALNALDNNSEDRAALVSLAKAKAGDMLELVTNEAVQLHGGIGMTDEAEIGLFLKRARVQQQLFGDSGFHRARYAGLMGF